MTCVLTHAGYVHPIRPGSKVKVVNQWGNMGAAKDELYTDEFYKNKFYGQVLTVQSVMQIPDQSVHKARHVYQMAECPLLWWGEREIDYVVEQSRSTCERLIYEYLEDALGLDPAVADSHAKSLNKKLESYGVVNL